MAYKVHPQLLRTTIIKIQFVRFEQDVNMERFRDAPVYRVDLVVNGTPYSYEVTLTGGNNPALAGFSANMKVFAPLKTPPRVVAGHVRRFAEGEPIVFPLDLGDIGRP
jgi:hypothetical protein